MANWSEFKAWFTDYGARFPAVGDYAAKHDRQGMLLQSWCETLTAFDADTLRAVTRETIAGKLLPVDNFKLGTFADEIRQRCRMVLDWRRRDRDMQQLQTMPARDPIGSDERTAHMLLCGVACDRILSERTGQPLDSDMRRYRSAYGVRPDIPYDAAIILADQHTEMEQREALATLERAGITFDEITQRAARLRREGIGLFKDPSEIPVS
jgi:hypothetical protein